MSHSQHCESKLDLALQDGYSKESSLEVEHLSSRTCDGRFSDKSNGSEITLPSNPFPLKEEGNILDHRICGKAGAGNKVENPAGNRTEDSGKALNKSATFPCSESLDTSILCTEIHSKIADGPACLRSKSLPGSLKLVSAMKGGQEVGSPKTKLNVTWAADVVDPPATSTSHTVRSYFQGHSRSRKKEKKHKHYKGKSSQGNNSKKQHSSSKRVAVNSLENPPVRMPPTASGKFSEEVNITSFVDIDSMGDVAGYGSSGQDSKCRSNYLNQSLGNMHLSFTEAT